MVSVDEDHHLAGIHDSTHTDRQSIVRSTFSTSLSKKRELAIIVSVVNVFWRVRLVRLDPGSLKAI